MAAQFAQEPRRFAGGAGVGGGSSGDRRAGGTPPPRQEQRLPCPTAKPATRSSCLLAVFTKPQCECSFLLSRILSLFTVVKYI